MLKSRVWEFPALLSHGPWWCCSPDVAVHAWGESLSGLGLAAIPLLLLPGAGINVYGLFGLGLLQMLLSVLQAALRLVALPCLCLLSAGISGCKPSWLSGVKV